MDIVEYIEDKLEDKKESMVDEDKKKYIEELLEQRNEELFEQSKKNKKELIDYPCGVYASMPDSVYFSIDAVSHSKVKSYLTQSRERAKLMEEQEVKDTKALRQGKMIHKAVLEPQDFMNEYKLPEVKLKDFLVGELKELCKQINIKPKAGLKKQELIDLISSETGYDDNADDGRIVIAHDEYEMVQGIMNNIANGEHKDLFTGGYAEVVVIWEDEEIGVKCKAKIDYLRIDKVIDLKTIEPKKETQFGIYGVGEDVFRHIAIKSFFKDNGYATQMAWYTIAVSSIITQNLDWFDFDEEWVKKFKRYDGRTFPFFAVARSEPYEMRVLDLRISESVGGEPNIYFERALQDLHTALNIMMSDDVIVSSSEVKDSDMGWLKNI